MAAPGLHEPTVAGLDLDTALHPLFQPVVELSTGAVVGYEALVRGPTGLAMPDELFASARAEGLVRELDWASRRVAVEAARASGVRHPLSLFVNAEPEALGGPPGGDAEDWRAMGDLRCFAEITERALTARPGELLRLADEVRAQDWGVALDDVGANPQTVALMPMLQPDVLKLDRSLLHEHYRLEVARATHAVLAQATDTGASVIAEGIETEEQRELAIALGVHLGQGYLLGRPEPLPLVLPVPVAPVNLLPRLRDRSVTPSPLAVVNDEAPTTRLTQAGLAAVWRQLEQQAAALRPAPIVLATFSSRADFDADAPRLAALAGQLPLVAAFGPPGALGELPGLRTQELPADDTVVGEQDLVVIGPQYAAAVVARPLPAGVTGATAYNGLLTFARPLVVGAANALLMRLA